MNLEGLPKFNSDPKLVRRFNFLWDEWKRAYPGINLENEIQWSHAWLLTSGKRYTDMARFINNWFRSAQRRALEGKNVVLHKPYKEAIPKDEELLTYEDIVQSKRKTS